MIIEFLKEYMTNNPTFTLVLAISVAALIVLCIILSLLRAAVRKRKAKSEKEKTARSIAAEDSSQPDSTETIPEHIIDTEPATTQIPTQLNSFEQAKTTILEDSETLKEENDLKEENHKKEEKDVFTEEISNNDPIRTESSESKSDIKDEAQPVTCKTVNIEQSADKKQPERIDQPGNKEQPKASKKSKPATESAKVKTVIEKTPTKEVKSTKESKDNVEIESAKYAGKWVIYEEDGRYVADLKASNGEKMLTTESYSSLSGIKSGIDTLKKNIEDGNYGINLDKNGNYVFKIFSTAKRLLCVGEGYSNYDQCEKAFASVKRFAKTAVVTVLREEK